MMPQVGHGRVNDEGTSQECWLEPYVSRCQKRAAGRPGQIGRSGRFSPNGRGQALDTSRLCPSSFRM
eukprot:6334510-Pyramimonas_sp.AAC.1